MIYKHFLFFKKCLIYILISVILIQLNACTPSSNSIEKEVKEIQYSFDNPDNNVVLKGGSAVVDSRDGKALKLDGSGSYAALPSGVVKDLNNFTITAWINPEQLSKGQRIFDFGNNKGTYMYLTTKNEGAKYLGLSFQISKGIFNFVQTAQTVATGTDVEAGKWSHVAVVKEGSTVKLFLDGIEVGRCNGVTLNPSDLGNTKNNYIGRSQTGEAYFNGIIDDFRIYNRALTDIELFDLGLNADLKMINKFGQDKVILLEGIYKEARDRDLAWLESLEADKFLYWFYEQAGIPPVVNSHYEGWENQPVRRGHSIGHYLTSAAMAYKQNPGTILKARADYAVQKLKECQDAYASKDPENSGYVFGTEVSIFDDLIALRPSSANTPWYWIHKVYKGLLDMYDLTGNQTALEVLIKLSDWSVKKLKNVNNATFQKMVIAKEIGGMQDTMIRLYEVTGKTEYKTLAEKFQRNDIYDSMAKYRDNLAGNHANTLLGAFVGGAHMYEVNPQNKYYRKATSFFWEAVVGSHTFVTGGNSINEHFKEPKIFDKYLMDPESVNVAETCNTYNLQKITNSLFTWVPSPKYADWYEKALINEILPSQNDKPQKVNGVTVNEGAFTYHKALATGSFRKYSYNFDSFWCCVNTGQENHLMHGDAIYFHDGQGLFVNQYISSRLIYEAKGAVIYQSTNYPFSDTTAIKIESIKNPSSFKIRFHIPYWAKNGAQIKVNGTKVDVDAQPSTYIALEREWSPGDTIELTMPMSLYEEPLVDNPDKIAIKYGPVLLAAQMGKMGLLTTHQFGQSKPTIVGFRPLPHAAFKNAGKDLKSWIRPVDITKLEFETFGGKGIMPDGSIQEYVLKPFFDSDWERYMIYFEVTR